MWNCLFNLIGIYVDTFVSQAERTPTSSNTPVTPLLCSTQLSTSRHMAIVKYNHEWTSEQVSVVPCSWVMSWHILLACIYYIFFLITGISCKASYYMKTVCFTDCVSSSSLHFTVIGSQRIDITQLQGIRCSKSVPPNPGCFEQNNDNDILANTFYE